MNKRQTWWSVIIGSLIVLINDTDWVGVEGLGIISGNWTVDDEVFIATFSFLLLIDDGIVIERVNIGGFKRLIDRCVV